ncbi:MAG: hypothetical protein Q4B26_05260 [Eubacteriales bacterium]|nr:hypothetical protein [Eubacteriales bacterium]
MKSKTNRPSGNLLLLELILILLFLSLAASVCVQLFFLSWKNQKQSDTDRQIQQLIIQFGEAIEGDPPNSSGLTAMYPPSEETSRGYLFFYNSDWEPCSKEDKVYTLLLEPSREKYARKWKLVFSSESDILAEQWIAYPDVSGKEDPS